MRPHKTIALLLFASLCLAFASSTQGMRPCANQIWPRFFYSGFDNGDTGDFIPVPPNAWQPGNGNTCYESLDLGCQSWAQAWCLDGFAYTDYILQASMQYKGGSCNRLGLVYRLRESSNFYLFVLQDGTTATLIRYTNDVADRTQSVPYAYLPDRWYVLRVEVAGADHSAYINGVPVLSWTDNSFLQGTGGLCAEGTHAWFDNFIVLQRPPIPPPLAQKDQDVITGDE